MTIQDRILLYLQEHPEGIDDDTLAAALSLKQRQQANSRCRLMADRGMIARKRVNGKIRNCLNPDASANELRSTAFVRVMPTQTSTDPSQPWFWEGNVQDAVVNYLRDHEYQIHFAANTATKQHGKDIIAQAPSGETLWVSAKGFPMGTTNTAPQTQARHWFARAIFDLILWRGENSSAVIALALPAREHTSDLSFAWNGSLP